MNTEKSIVVKLWEFCDKSPVLSAILISLIALTGTVLVRFYTFIYWLPYFRLLNIPLHYFQDAAFDKYSFFYNTIKNAFVLYLCCFLLLKIRAKLNNKVTVKIVYIVLSLTSMLAQTLLSRTRAIIDFFRIDVWFYISTSSIISLAIILLRDYQNALKVKIRTATLVLLACSLLVGIGVLTYIQGYNENYVSVLVGVIKTIDDDKAVLFETSDKYYVIPCVIEDNTIKLYINSYTLTEKNDKLVTNRLFRKVTNQFGVKIE